MSSDNKSSGSDPQTPGKQAKAVSNNLAIALELPFTFVGAVAVGVLLGYFLDRALHTRAVFMVILGALGFIAGLREVIRRLPG
jgi:F0F1-type ATP synthase assembly protein I